MRQCGLLAKELNGFATSDYSISNTAEYLITALPAAIIPEAVKELKPFLQQNQILINISTDTTKKVFEPLKNSCKLASAKIIGHAKQIGAGELPLILVDAEDQNTRNKVAKIFSRIGVIRFGEEKLVKMINNIASEESQSCTKNRKKA